MQNYNPRWSEQALTCEYLMNPWKEIEVDVSSHQGLKILSAACIDCKIFTKLDLRQGYHQQTLDPVTTQVATFSISWGNYRPKNAKDGLKPSTDKVKAVKECKPSRKQRSHPKFSSNDRLLAQQHQQVCGHSSTTLSANPERQKIQMEQKRRKSIQKDSRQHLKREDGGIFWL